MDETTILWLFGTLIAVQVPIMGSIAWGLWSHVIHCRRVEGSIESVKSDLKHIRQEIGTHDSGLRGSVHKQHNSLMKLDGRVSLLEDRQ